MTTSHVLEIGNRKYLAVGQADRGHPGSYWVPPDPPEIYVEELYLLPEDFTGACGVKPPDGASEDLYASQAVFDLMQALGATDKIDEMFAEAEMACDPPEPPEPEYEGR